MIKLVIIFTAISFISCGSEMETSINVNERSQAEIVEEEQIKRTESKVPRLQKTKEISSFYRTVSLYRSKLKVSIPDYFTEMSSEMKLAKYPRGNSPDVVYTDENGTVNVALSYTTTEIVNNDISAMQNIFLQQLQAAAPIGLTSRIESINGSKFAVFEFMSQAIDTRVYNLMFLTELNGRMLLGTFNCTEALKGEWQSIATEILLSIQKG